MTPTACGRRLAATWCLAMGLAAPSIAPAQAPDIARPAATAPCSHVPQVKPSLEIHRATGPIAIDGDLGDPGWLGAARADHFTEIRPGDQVEPPVATEAWITYDDHNLYIAFKAQDDPKAVQATLCDRDEIFQDDFVGILLDTYGDAAWAYEIFSNPIGIQGDLRWTPNGEDGSFNLVMNSRGRIVADGYVVEFAIPFSSLRFPERASQTWRAIFFRTHPRDSRRQYSWAAIPRDETCFPCQFGTWTGIENVQRGTSLELLPAVTGAQFGNLRDDSDPASGLENSKMDADLAMGVRYALTSSAVVDATLNPDFSQVESDAAQIDVNSTFALFYPERRPFFQEGSDLFDTLIDAVYTRSLNDPQGAVKLTGRAKRTSLAYIGARDAHTPIVLPFEERSRYLQAGKSTSNILRLKHTILDDSFVGALVTDQRLVGGGSGTVLGGDVRLGFLKNYRFEGQWLASRTAEPETDALTRELVEDDPSLARFERGQHTTTFDGETFWGDAVYASVEREARIWHFDFEYRHTSPAFRAANGFVTQNDNRQATFWTGTLFRPDTRLLDEFRPNVSIGRVWNFDGARKDEWLVPELAFEFKKQTGLSVNYLWSNELFRGIQFDGIRRFAAEAWSNYSSHFKPGLYVSGGRSIARNPRETFGHPDPVPFLGESLNLSAWADIKPLQRLVVTPQYDYAQMRYPDGGEFDFRGYILRTRVNYQFTRELFMRLVVQYNQFNDGLEIDPLLTYKLNPFTVAYVGSTHDWRELDGTHELTQTARQFFLKFQYLFRI
jgi:hypothetical protein